LKPDSPQRLRDLKDQEDLTTEDTEDTEKAKKTFERKDAKTQRNSFDLGPPAAMGCINDGLAA
jgi:hypothetical protein